MIYIRSIYIIFIIIIYIKSKIVFLRLKYSEYNTQCIFHFLVTQLFNNAKIFHVTNAKDK